MTEQATVSSYTRSFSIAVGTTFTIWLLLFSTAVLFPFHDPGSVHEGSTPHMESDLPSGNMLVRSPASPPLPATMKCLCKSFQRCAVSLQDILVQTSYVPDPPTTVPFDASRFKKGSLDLPLDAPPLARNASSVDPDQIHIALAGMSDVADGLSSLMDLRCRSSLSMHHSAVCY